MTMKVVFMGTRGVLAQLLVPVTYTKQLIHRLEREKSQVNITINVIKNNLTVLLVDLAHVALAYPVELMHGQKYYVTVEAVNNVVHGGALVTTVRHSTPLVIDTTPPVIDGIRVEMFDSSTGYLSVQVNAR